jgi:hypothetical protein
MLGARQAQMKLDLQVRDLKSGNRFPKPFASVEEAAAWLKERPKFTEVLGIASHHVPAETSAELKACCRPLDAEEQLLCSELDAAEVAAARKRAEERMRKEAAEAEAQRKEMANADPNRPMDLRYTFDTGLAVADPMDGRPISDEVRAVVVAWIEERNSWVESRNQVVGEAKLSVYPAAIPAGQSERIIAGSFIPVTGPPKPQ